ncbi:hypothetical protein G6M16_007515 [Agrobacterium tumefaciens]|nr:hypothetical protein G6M16_007515 [Agrobacterium tumefaciens]
MAADYGDWIIKGVAGEFYPCKPDIFEATYDAVVSAGDTDPDPAPAQLHSWFSKAALDVTAERRRQIEAEGYGNRHDDAHTSFEITKAAVAYAQRAAMSDDVRAFKEKRDHVPGLWPWARAWWKPKGRRADLVRAAALLIAEIERLDRAEAKS